VKIKRYFASDMRQAMRQVRDEQGPDAVILSSRRVEGGVEVVSAVDFDERLVSEMAGAAPEPAAPSAFAVEAGVPQEELDWLEESLRPEPELAAAAVEPKREVVWTQDPAIVEMQREMKQMRDLLQDQLSQLAWADLARRQPARAQLIRRLRRLGLATAHAQRLAAQVGDIGDGEIAWQQSLKLLTRQLACRQDDLLERGGTVALVGPTGVGKTTTAAKLAARFAMRHGRREVALVSADAYRIGAHKQLLTFGQLIGVEVHAAETRPQLQQLLQGLRDRKLVLIDTAGMSQRDMRLGEQFGALDALAGLQLYLVTSVTAQRGVLDEVVRAFTRQRVNGCVLTKIDEAAGLGDALSVAIQHRLPLSYMSDGQRVPEDLHPARAERLIARAVALGKARERALAAARRPQAGGNTAHAVL
jgi:flagellar biosynthesis protein FlhF